VTAFEPERSTFISAAEHNSEPPSLRWHFLEAERRLWHDANHGETLCAVGGR